MRLSFYVGVMGVAIGLFCGAFLAIESVQGKTVSGWASLVTIGTLWSGLILVAQGILGEYVGRVFLAIKHRPTYIVRHTEGFGRHRNDATDGL